MRASTLFEILCIGEALQHHHGGGGGIWHWIGVSNGIFNSSDEALKKAADGAPLYNSANKFRDLLTVLFLPRSSPAAVKLWGRS